MLWCSWLRWALHSWGSILWNNFGRSLLSKLTEMARCKFVIMTFYWFKMTWTARLFYIICSQINYICYIWKSFRQKWNFIKFVPGRERCEEDDPGLRGHFHRLYFGPSVVPCHSTKDFDAQSEDRQQCPDGQKGQTPQILKVGVDDVRMDDVDVAQNADDVPRAAVE
jgi:hypothetical protein